MTVQHVKGEVAFSCDDCPETIETGGANITEAWSRAKEKGWHALVPRGTWKHYCPDCWRNL